MNACVFVLILIEVRWNGESYRFVNTRSEQHNNEFNSLWWFIMRQVCAPMNRLLYDIVSNQRDSHRGTLIIPELVCTESGACMPPSILIYPLKLRGGYGRLRSRRSRNIGSRCG